MPRCALVLAVAVALALGACRPRPPVATPAALSPPVVVVTVVVDQLAAFVALERWPLLDEAGGFARLRREGTWVEEVRLPYAVSDTAPGHAALYTGAAPAVTGIDGNERYDAAGGRVSILADPAAPGGASLARLRVETLADALRAARPAAPIVALSLKDRGALFGAGRRPTLALWLDPGRAAFVGHAAGGALPDWVAAPLPGRDAPWTPRRPAWVAAHAGRDDQPGEGDLAGLGVAFPHHWGRAARPGVAFRATPFADEAVLALAERAVAALRRPGEPMLLALSLSANDYVGHTFGPASWEAWDHLDRLDQALARLFAFLDGQVGPAGWALVLSADHGVGTLPELPISARPFCAGGGDARFDRPCGAGGRLLQDALGRELAEVAARALGPGRWVLGVADPWVFLSDEARALAPARRRVLDEALRGHLLGRPEIAAVFTPPERARSCPPVEDEGIEALVCRSMPVGASGDLYVVTRPGFFFDPGYTPGYGVSHGTPYRHDRAVPLLVRAPGRVAAGRVIPGPLDPASFARTAAALLGVPPPAAAAPGVVLVR